ncbi:hypothetical protein [Edaphocola flava]|uniref:hypothetical protein n=1 Tax=Edaphocola flava TaxID=2499629 RepID=UPI00100B6AF9|nr:hypothetical protein [Edaphocola flava]
MKEQLLKAYQDRQADFKTVKAKFSDEDMAGPFLMSPNDKYAQQPFPLLIVGQETNGWDYHVDDLNKQMRVYENFNVGINYYASTFWNVTRKVEQALGNEPHTCSWTNISKFDLDGGRSYGEYETAIATLDNLLLTEIKIIKPKVCLFLSGPSFDGRLKNIFPDIEFAAVTGHSSRELSQLKHLDLPTFTFRSYHPNYLRRSGLEPEFINFIASLTK